MSFQHVLLLIFFKQLLEINILTTQRIIKMCIKRAHNRMKLWAPLNCWCVCVCMYACLNDTASHNVDHNCLLFVCDAAFRFGNQNQQKKQLQ